MWEFIVLGLVPGTQIEVTFLVIIMVLLLAAISALAWLEHRTRACRAWIITFSLLLITRKTFLQP